jgi:hypothetical protein
VSARRLVLSLFFRAALGIERVFHFETLDDLGFAILSGGKKVMSRSRLGGLVRAVKTAGVTKFTQATEALQARSNEVSTLSVDEHVIARFTRKFKIPKGFHTIRNKKMRAEKLSYLYWPKVRRFLSLLVSRGNAKLIDLTIDLLRNSPLHYPPAGCSAPHPRPDTMWERPWSTLPIAPILITMAATSATKVATSHKQPFRASA